MQQTGFWGNQQKASKCTVTIENGSLVFKSPYDASLVSQIKALPYSDRRWDGARKVWIIDPKHSAALTGIVSAFLGEVLVIPSLSIPKTVKETRLLEVHYIGACKDRDGESLAFGYVNNQWSVVFPETVLRAWFDAGPVAAPGETVTLYAVLGITATVTGDEIKTAYRRMAKQWHPDVCREPNAAEQFMRIQKALEILSIPNKRARYDAGLALERSMTHEQKGFQVLEAALYRSPLRCGYIMAVGLEKISRFYIEKILAWEDITDGERTLVVSWPMGAKAPTEVWA